MPKTDPALTWARPALTWARSLDLRERAYIVPLTFGRARIVIDETPNVFYEKEFW